MIIAARPSSKAMPQSSSRLVNTPTERSEARSVRAANAVPTAHHHAQEGHGDCLLVGVVQWVSRAHGITGVPARVAQDVEEAPHGERGSDEAEEEPRTNEHRRLHDALVVWARRTIHDSGFGGLASKGERGQRLRADIERQQEQDAERKRNRAAREGKDQEGDDFGSRVSEDVEDELADVVVDNSAGFDRGDDRREVVVGEDHGRGFAGDVGPGASHRDTDVGALKGGSVVDAVAGHRDDVSFGPKRIGDAELGFR